MKNYRILLLLLLITAVLAPSSNAAVFQYDADGYTMPATWTTVAEVEPIDLNHNKYYYWVLDDFNTSPSDLHQVDIVFHNIYNWDTEENFLNLYLADYAGDDAGFYTLHDNQELDNPSWTGWTHVGTWSDVDGPATVNDVVYTITGDELAWFVNGDQFIIGIDPDCHFFGGDISVNVPEPASLILFGTGLIGLMGVWPKRKKGIFPI